MDAGGRATQEHLPDAGANVRAANGLGGARQEPRVIQLYMKQPCVYILASGWDGTLYVGVTSDLVKRVWEHKNDFIEGFTKRYRVHDLVWFEQHETMESAILREKAIKEWNRARKTDLIEGANRTWRDLYFDLL
jgi:putative endonuclease